ncbi:phosphodiesterase [Mesorhizobium neociceri]|uniref:Phosphodiesterase n=1 Tax=Mesorhizobium neociceri TaxID=1307853 RepID=A0A838B6S9_9HYPH|nr:phosphodiesterase [Mesorhizobium neociceri]MBA1142326.1 phosphodiesterase [Mesorhizobium neociceri]
MKIIQLSDTHLVAGDGELFGLHPARRLLKCLKHIVAHHGDAELVVFTGDLVHDGDPLAYLALKEIVAHFSLPIRLLLGNHDHRENFRGVFPGCEVDENGFVQSSFDKDGVRCIFLDTHVPDEGYGLLCSARLEWLRSCVSAAGDKRLLIFMHHAPEGTGFGVPGFSDIAFVDPESFWNAVAAGHVLQIFAGHYHLPVNAVVNGHPVVVSRGTSHQIVLDLANFRRPEFVDAEPTYNVILVGGDSVCVHEWSFLNESTIVRPHMPK